MHIKTHKFFNSFTRQAMFEKVTGYVDKSIDPEVELERIRSEYQPERIYRFDLGENAEGYSPMIRAYLDELRSDGKLLSRLNEYPDRNHTKLVRKLARKFGVSPDWCVVGAGLDSILDCITRVFLDHRDVYLMPVPSFYLFEEYSERMGAIPIFLELKEEDDYRWTVRTTQTFKKLVDKFRPKLIWIANPNNPTGQFIQEMVLEDLIEYAKSYNAFIVIDEAYGEYTDTPDDVHSAAKFLHRYENLMVLRTFSKKYGLASLRIGYLMCASSEILEGIQIHRHHFPVTQISADLASIALEDEAFLCLSRMANQAHRREVFDHLGALPSFMAIPTTSNIFMLKNRHLSGEELKEAFARRGIIASGIDLSGIKGKGYVRITLRNQEDNLHLCQVCEGIDQEFHPGKPIRLSRIAGTEFQPLRKVQN